MKAKLYISLIAAAGLLLSFGLQNNGVEKPAAKAPVYILTTKDTLFVAGAKIQIGFTTSADSLPQMVVTSSYGTTLLDPVKKGRSLTYTFPAFFARKTGKVSWQLTSNNKKLQSGSFIIIPEGNITHPEDYLGPRSMLTGDGHFTMMVATPTDGFDNPKPEGTPVIIKSQFLQDIQFTTLPVEHFIAWKRIYAPEKSGKVLTSIACMGIESKETETDVYANLPVNFTLACTRNHDFADGNQETTLTTSILKDKFGNVVEDGTQVMFSVLPSNGVLLKTYGATINGVAKAKLLAPDHADIYTVTAYVNGMAQSTPLTFGYKPIKTDIPFAFSKNKETITVGPLHSFMGQIAPDGTVVSVTVYQNGNKVNTIINYTSKGMAVIELPAGNMKGAYRFTISVFGNTVATQKITYEQHKQ